MNLRMAQGKMRSWVADFRALQQLRDCVPDPELLAAATRNLQLIADDLKDLLQGMNSCSESSEAEASARERTMKEALARTVQVLLQTRQNFKCKRLGELRADLSQLLDKMP